jgi:hypothetical protein
MEWQALLAPLVPLAGPLIGALVGGAISTMTAVAIERQRGKREKAEKRAELRREALTAALEWIAPMRNTYIRGSGVAMAVARGVADEDTVRERFPDMLSVLTPLGLTGVQRAMLPDGLYERGHEIIRMMDDLRSSTLNEAGSKHIQRPPLSGIDECLAKTTIIERAILKLENDMRAERRKTFD